MPYKKRINPNKFFIQIDRGQGRRLLQDRMEFDPVSGLSIEDFETEEEQELKAEIKLASELILPKSQKPYPSQQNALMNMGRKKLDPKEYHAVPYKGGYAIARIDK